MLSKFKHIVIADDDHEDVELLKESLAKSCSDLDFTLADNGCNLLNALKTTSPPDLIILDINMPVMDGKECLKVIKSNQLMKAIPIMMYSTSTNKKDIEACYSFGADYYVIKPSSIEEIEQLAEEICTGEIKSSINK
ncbi:response regulator [Segetibacter koreensis]|uniref:response regulator n=1 Tax=Segetibacter koreensis TaxID=398037 RepID=UPI00037A0841|nr:response regulator [Segetibacter koreensis]